MESKTRLFRMVGVGNRDFAAWIEPGDTAVTITIDSDPQVRYPITPYFCEREALKYFCEFLKRHGATLPECKEDTKLTKNPQQVDKSKGFTNEVGDINKNDSAQRTQSEYTKARNEAAQTEKRREDKLRLIFRAGELFRDLGFGQDNSLTLQQAARLFDLDEVPTSREALEEKREYFQSLAEIDLIRDLIGEAFLVLRQNLGRSIDNGNVISTDQRRAILEHVGEISSIFLFSRRNPSSITEQEARALFMYEADTVITSADLETRRSELNQGVPLRRVKEIIASGYDRLKTASRASASAPQQTLSSVGFFLAIKAALAAGERPGTISVNSARRIFGYADSSTMFVDLDSRRTTLALFARDQIDPVWIEAAYQKLANFAQPPPV